MKTPAKTSRSGSGAPGMRVVILCGGLGTRLSEETANKPKPMVEVGGQPILWHIMKVYAAAGFKEFALTLGYRGDVIKDYFLNYHFHSRSLTVRLPSGRVEAHSADGEDWTVHLLDTGLATNTGGRVRQAARFIGRKPFMLTYGDGVADIDIPRLLEFHRRQRRLVTVTAVRPPARFGDIVFDGDLVKSFTEKHPVSGGWINGGFFVIEPAAVDYIKSDDVLWEGAPMERLAREGQVAAYRHEGYWQCMDTLRDLRSLEGLWQSGKAPWKVW